MILLIYLATSLHKSCSLQMIVLFLRRSLRRTSFLFCNRSPKPKHKSTYLYYFAGSYWCMYHRIMDVDSTLYQMRLRSNVRVSTWKEPPLAPAARATTTMPHGRQRRRFNNKCAMIVLIGFVALCFLSVAGNKRSHHNLRQTMPETRCDISSYPLWKLSDFKELDLSGCGNTLNLPDDPKIWASFSSLKKLDLNNNQLNILPKSIENIPSLEILFLSYNEFQSIPELNKMKKLSVLSLRGNLITNISSSNLPTATLEWLILTNNRIQTIDANI